MIYADTCIIALSAKVLYTDVGKKDKTMTNDCTNKCVNELK